MVKEKEFGIVGREGKGKGVKVHGLVQPVCLCDSKYISDGFFLLRINTR